MVITRAILTLAIIAFLSCDIIKAQEFELGGVVGIGGNTYVGDLNPGRETRQLNIQAAFNRYVDHRSFFKLGVNIGQIWGEYEAGDNLNPEINTYFRGNLISADISYNWELIQWSFLHVYTGAGLGYLDYTIQDREGRKLNDRASTRLENESYETRLAYFPINLGFILFPRRQVNLIYEHSWNLTTSDYLDNIGYLGDNRSDWILRRMFLVRYRF